MRKLHELIAHLQALKPKAATHVTEAYKQLQKPDSFDGMTRSYKPYAEDGEKLPPEYKQPQQSVKALVTEATDVWRSLFDAALLVDTGNTQAKGDITVDGQVLAPNVPVQTLLFLENELQNVAALIGRIPTPDASETWHYDPNSDCLVSAPSQTVRSKKTKKALVLHAATKEHPAQTTTFDEDIGVGIWETIRQSKKLPAAQRAEMLKRVTALIDAVRSARMRANDLAVKPVQIGNALLSYVFSDKIPTSATSPSGV